MLVKDRSATKRRDRRKIVCAVPRLSHSVGHCTGSDAAGDVTLRLTAYSAYPLRWPFFLLFKNFDSMQRNSKTGFYHSAETSAIESSSKSGLEKVFKSLKF